MKYYCVLEKEDDCYNVSFPDIPNAITFGTSKDNALEMAKEVLNAILEVEILHNNKITEPKFSKGFPIEVEPNIAFALALRKNRGKNSQVTIAEKLNISYQQYQRLEDPKKSNPTLKTIHKLEKIFNTRFINI